MHLDANTTYWVYIWAGEDATVVEVDNTGFQFGETGAAGWSIGNSALIRPEGTAYSNYTQSPTVVKMKVEGVLLQLRAGDFRMDGL